MDQGSACYRRHLVDGWHALSAAAVRLSLRGRGRLEAIRNIQADGAAAAQGHHQPGDDRDLARRTFPGLERALVFVELAPRETCAGDYLVRCPRFFFSLG